jgi:threonyl-tRNA synthetase
MERFVGILIEHYAGAFPAWLAPVQVRILPISDEFAEYAQEVCESIKTAGLRVELDSRNEKIGYKIREAELQKIPYMLIIGKKEVEQASVSVRKRKDGDIGSLSVSGFIERIHLEVKEKTIN